MAENDVTKDQFNDSNSKEEIHSNPEASSNVNNSDDYDQNNCNNIKEKSDKISTSVVTEIVIKSVNNSPANDKEKDSTDLVSEFNDKIDVHNIKKKTDRYKLLRLIFSIIFIICAALLINEVLIQPYRTNKALEQINELYQGNDFIFEDYQDTSPETTNTIYPIISENEDEISAVIVQDPNRDSRGRLLQFRELLKVNEDVKGWISIPETNINYVVLQSTKEDPEYYLTKNIFKEEDKAGSLFLDYKSSIENNVQNLVIHGHNMYSTDNMFHYLTEYKTLDYYKDRPVFTFDTIYQTGKWKIFSIFITNGTTKKEKLFNYTRPNFNDPSDFLNFVYQLRIRSLFLVDDVDINENDQLLTLSTCSYEVKDYRTVIVARKVREGEDLTVEVDGVIENTAPLYPWSWYYRYGGKAPKITDTFEAALEAGEINWYNPIEE